MQQIKALTLQAVVLIDDDNIQQCHAVLDKRQTLLEELMAQYQILSVPDSVFKQKFIELIAWIKEHDSVNSARVMKLRELSKQSSVKQNKINKALHHYKSII